MLSSYEWNFPMKRTHGYSPCEQECVTLNVGANKKLEQRGLPPLNINFYLPFEDTPIRADPPSVKLPITYFFAIIRLSA